MNHLEFMLIFACTILPLWFAYKRSRVNNGFEINHVTLFSFGFLFYWVLPIAIAPFVAEQTGENWASLSEAASQTKFYFFSVLLAYVMFACGDLFATRMFRTRWSQSGKFRKLHQAALFFPIIPLYTAIVFFTIEYRSLLFHEYTISVEMERARGTIAAGVVVLGSIALLHISDNASLGIKRLAKSPLVAPFILGAAYLLLLGTRLYIVSFVLMLFVYYSCFYRPLPLKKIGFGVLSIGLISGIIGTLRVGEDTSKFWINLILEPLFTSFSLLYFLSFNQISWIAFPKYLFTDLTNLIPTVLFPDKSSLGRFPYVYSPSGGMHSFVSFNFNFGIIGTAAFMFLLPIVLRKIRSRPASQLRRVQYTMLSGWLTFTFFRDPFSVSLVKSMLEFSLIVPALIVGTSRFIQSTVPLCSSAD